MCTKKRYFLINQYLKIVKCDATDITANKDINVKKIYINIGIQEDDES